MAGGEFVTCALYRHFDTNDTLLYVGVSMTLLQRTLAHNSASEWFTQVAKITVEHYETRDVALIAETRAIEDEKPLYNVDQTPKRMSGPRECPAHLVDTTYGRKQVAKLLGCNSHTVVKWSKKWPDFPQKLPGVWPDRWYINDIDAYIKGFSASLGVHQ